MFVGSRSYISEIPPSASLGVGDDKIAPDNALKILGMSFDSFLIFDKHVTDICKKTWSMVMFINRIKDNLSVNARRIALQSLVLSRINYGITIWGSTTATQRHRVQKIQNFAAKVALGGGAKYDHVTPFLIKLGWLKVDYKYKYELGTTLYKNIKGTTPRHTLRTPTVGEIRTLPTRQQQNLYEPKTNTSTGARSILVAGPKLWNSLPENVRTASTLPTFKKLLYKQFINDQFER